MDRLTKDNRPSWNPLDCSSSPLPLPLLLCAKLMIIYLLATGEFLQFPEPFLSFIPLLEKLAYPVLFQNTLKFIFLTASLLLLFNRYVRSASFITGAILLIALVASKPYYSDPTLFFACFLMLIGLYSGTLTYWFLRAQLALVYLGGGLNKLLDAEWRSGQFYELWTSNTLQLDWYVALSQNLAPALLSKIMGWLTIISECFLAVAFMVPSLTSVAITLGVIFHIGMFVLTQMEVAGIFLYAAASAYLTLLNWPETATDNKTREGIRAVTASLRYNPLTYFLLAGLFLLLFGVN